MFSELWTKWMMIPYDTLAWWNTITNRQPPQWSTPNKVLLESPFALLRDFSVGDDDVVPTFIFPPMSGHSSHVIDFEGQSQIQLVIKHGLTKAYSFDWLAATQESKNITIEDRMDFITCAVSLITDSKVNIIGNCQGGWEAAIWAALNPERVNTLIVAGAPIDTSVDINPELLPVIRSFQVMGPAATDATLRAIVASEGGVHRGLSQISFFMMMHPMSHQFEYIRVYNHIREPEAVKRFTRFYDWYFNPVDMPGALFQWCVTHLFINNELYKGTLEVGGEKADPRKITAPVFLLAGETDDITPAKQQMNMADIVSSEQIEKYMTPGGHLGVFISHRSQTTVWPQMLTQVRKLS